MIMQRPGKSTIYTSHLISLCLWIGLQQWYELKEEIENEITDIVNEISNVSCNVLLLLLYLFEP